MITVSSTSSVGRLPTANGRRRLAVDGRFHAVITGDAPHMLGRITALSGDSGKLDATRHLGGDLRREGFSPRLQRLGGTPECVRLAHELVVGLDNGHPLSVTDQRVAIHGAKSNGTVVRDASSQHDVA